MNVQALDRHAGYDKNKLFILSVVALTTAGMVFSIRANILADLQKTFFDTTDPLHTAGLVTAVAGFASIGMAIALLVGSALCDSLGMRSLLAIACVLHI